MGNDFLPQRGNYRNLRVYQVAESIYDITVLFCQRFLDKRDRTVDQMVQAARSGKQNIAEGSVDGATSKEMEIKLTNVAKASLQELLMDYEDFLRVRNLPIWDKSSNEALRTREICRNNNDSSFYRAVANDTRRSATAIANIAIILIHQADVMLRRLIERQKSDFLKYGGIREQMTRAQLAYRNNQSNLINQSNQSNQSNQNNQSNRSNLSNLSNQSNLSNLSNQSNQSNQSNLSNHSKQSNLSNHSKQSNLNNQE